MTWIIATDLPIVSTLSAFLLFYISVKCFNYLISDQHVLIRDPSKTHNWKSVNLLSRDTYCNICSQLMITGEGLFCDCCGVCSDSGCINEANQKLPCKAISMSNTESMKHHWVKGNLSYTSVCEICEEECGLESGLQGLKCCWCQRTVHTPCKKNMAEVCDFGPYRSLIIPPTSVEVERKRNSVRRRLILKAVVPPNWPQWTPLIVIANCRAGNKDGDNILSLFRTVLNPGQVVDLADKQPEAALEWCSMLKNIPAKILVAGGDGTIGWILNTINKLNLDPVPAVAILPLGTGNDMSRVLGWGKSTSSSIDPISTLEAIQSAEVVDFDRWKVEINPYRSLRLKPKPKSMFMYNYLSIGVDAQVTLNFHRTRESPFYLFSSRIFNKLLYLGYGTHQIIEKTCQNLDTKIDLYLDGKLMELPPLESIVVLNIDSWGAGVQLWEMGKEEEEDDTIQSYNDGIVEVLAIYSSLHIAQLQVGLSLPHRIGQASTVKIKLKAPTAVQVDGEPWEQHPAEFTVTHCNKATMLKGSFPS